MNILFYNFQVCLAYKSCTAEELDIRWLKSRCQGKDQYVFEEFCGIVTEYRQQVGISVTVFYVLLCILIYLE